MQRGNKTYSDNQQPMSCEAQLAAQLYGLFIPIRLMAAIGARRHGQGGTCPSSENVVKCLFVLEMLTKISVDEVFMHYFKKMSSASGGLPQTSTRALPLYPLGTSVL